MTDTPKTQSTPAIDGDTQRNITAALEPYAAPPHLPTSLKYLGLNLLYCAVVVSVTYYVRTLGVATWILAPSYALVMGTVSFGLWVLGHECGHGAFAPKRWQNDLVGFVLHSALLVPYWSWQYSHAKHHRYTSHTIMGETHVPKTSESKDDACVSRLLGCRVKAAFKIFKYLLFGWPAYLLVNKSGGMMQINGKTPLRSDRFKDHFHSGSQVMPRKWTIEASTVGCLCTMLALWWSGRQNAMLWYLGPWVVVNAWLTLVTWLHHTDVDVPHYGPKEFTWLRGALSTVDRPYHWFFNHLHHNIGSTHVLHHLRPKIPHYRAVAATAALKPVLGTLYRSDSTPMRDAVWRAAHMCTLIKSREGIQYYKER